MQNQIRRIFLFVFLALTGLLPAQNAEMVVEGKYRGKSLYFQNPFAADGKNFCCGRYEVYRGSVKLLGDSVKESAFEVPLKSLPLELGDSVLVRLFHQKDCKPKLLNFDHYPAEPKFEIARYSFEKDSAGIQLHFSAVHEDAKHVFVVQQFRWNKWIKIGEVDGKGGDDTNHYKFRIPDLHSGSNTFRILQTKNDGTNYFSNVMNCNFKGDIVTHDNSSGAVMKLSRVTMYEVYDQYGNIVKKGTGSEIDFSSYKKNQKFFVNIDNKTITYTRN